VGAVVSVLAALSCCLPLGPFLLAAGSAGVSGLMISWQPYLIGFSILMLIVGFGQAFRARHCGRRQRRWNLAMLVSATVLVATVLGVHIWAGVPAPGSKVASFSADSFRHLFNAAADRPRLVVLLSPT
jgi:hypothetical protein